MLSHVGEVASKHISIFTLTAKGSFPGATPQMRTVACFNEAHAL